LNKLIIFLLLLITLASCGIVINTMNSQNRLNLLKIEIGMTKDEVNEIMGTEIYSYWEYSNPHKREQFYANDGKVIEIYYYLINKKGSENERFSPVLFVDNIVEGVGWRSFERAISKYEININ